MNCSPLIQEANRSNDGFTLVEMLVTMVVALVILGGLLLSFMQQNSEYKYQNKRIDAVQDLELGIKFIAEDLRSAVMASQSSVTADVASGNPFVQFKVWESSDPLLTPGEYTRRYEFDTGDGILKYDRDTSTPSLSSFLLNVTNFKVFIDNPLDATDRVGYTGIPEPQSGRTRNRQDGSGTLVVPTLTLLIEVAVDAGYKQGSFKDVEDNNVGIAGKKRIWRYVQIQPQTAL